MNIYSAYCTLHLEHHIVCILYCIVHCIILYYELYIYTLYVMAYHEELIDVNGYWNDSPNKIPKPKF